MSLSQPDLVHSILSLKVGPLVDFESRFSTKLTIQGAWAGGGRHRGGLHLVVGLVV